MHFFFYFAQELTWGPAIRGTRRAFAPDWRWLHVGEMAIFLLVPALFLTFYCGNWPKKFSMPVNVLIRTGIAIVGGILLYIVYYKTSHLFLGTQKGFSHPQQFPMIPTIWLINIWLVHHWFMDNWPGMENGTENRGRNCNGPLKQETMINDVRWNPTFGWGLGAGAVAGIALYFIAIWAMPIFLQCNNHHSEVGGQDSLWYMRQGGKNV